MAALAACWGLIALAGCSPAIGDSCSSSASCSQNGTRICDTAAPGGYCTILGCDPDSCPGDNVCVEWRFSPSRTAQTYCMDRCGGCRSSYRCMGADDPALVTSEGEVLARVIDTNNRDARFCVAETTTATSSALFESRETTDPGATGDTWSSEGASGLDVAVDAGP